MRKPIVYRTDRFLNILEPRMDRLTPHADVVTATGDDAAVFAREVGPAEIILTCYDPIPASVINAAPNLKGIVKYGVGVNNIDLAAATARGVMVANAPAYGTDTVAEHAFALMICLAKKLLVIDKLMRRDAWAWPEPSLMGNELMGKTLGLVGFGRIGRAMAKKAAGFDMRLMTYDPYVEPSVAAGLGVTMVPLRQLVAEADVLSIHCVLTPETTGLISDAHIRAMKRSALVINVSRAGVIDEPALRSALQEGRLAGAGLDVFHAEPLTADDPLLRMDHVILTPHLAWYTEEAFDRCEEQTLESVLDILAGRVPQRLKNTDVLNVLSSSSS